METGDQALSREQATQDTDDALQNFTPETYVTVSTNVTPTDFILKTDTCKQTNTP